MTYYNKVIFFCFVITNNYFIEVDHGYHTTKIYIILFAIIYVVCLSVVNIFDFDNFDNVYVVNDKYRRQFCSILFYSNYIYMDLNKKQNK